jgi:hypothetical protein
MKTNKEYCKWTNSNLNSDFECQYLDFQACKLESKKRCKHRWLVYNPGVNYGIDRRHCYFICSLTTY